MIEPGRRVGTLPTYAVAALAVRKRELLADGVDVIDLGAGDAPVSPPPLAVETLAAAAREPEMSRYAFQSGLIGFREAVARYMDRRFGVTVDPVREVLPLIGSKEGLAHLPLAMTDPGDVCVVPEPGYPAYAGGVVLAGADVERYPLRAEEGFLVDLERIPAARLARTRIVFLNYPNNPTGAIAPEAFLRRTVDICRERGILLAYDNPYVELTYDGYRAPSILAVEGARDVAIEFHSLSKSFGLTGWRLGWATGNSTAIEALSKVKSYIDTGVFLAVQRVGAALLDRMEEVVTPVRAMFCERRDALVAALAEKHWEVPVPAGGMYLWLPLAEGMPSAAFAREALETEGLVTLAGSGFGPAGEGFVRLSFIVGSERLREAAGRLARVRERLTSATAGA